MPKWLRGTYAIPKWLVWLTVVDITIGGIVGIQTVVDWIA